MSRRSTPRLPSARSTSPKIIKKIFRSSIEKHLQSKSKSKHKRRTLTDRERRCCLHQCRKGVLRPQIREQTLCSLSTSVESLRFPLNFSFLTDLNPVLFHNYFMIWINFTFQFWNLIICCNYHESCMLVSSFSEKCSCYEDSIVFLFDRSRWQVNKFVSFINIVIYESWLWKFSDILELHTSS